MSIRLQGFNSRAWFTALLACMVMPAMAATLYVKPVALGNCTSWTDACSLQAALANVLPGDTIWVASGTYWPTPGSDRSSSFHIPMGVAVYGGFSGAETDFAARRPWLNITVLSGDIGALNNSSDNSHHVVFMDGDVGDASVATTVLDGFVIRAGNANGAGLAQSSGGGLYCRGNGNGACSPILSNLVFEDNNALHYGGAIFNAASGGGVSSPVIRNAAFNNNTAELGGAIFNDGYTSGLSNPQLDAVTFSGNQAESGGAMYNEGTAGSSNPRLANVTFYDNHASNDGGAIFNDGRNGDSSPILTNVTFSNNEAVSLGGGMYNDAENGSSTPRLSNVILWASSAGSGGGSTEINNHGGATPIISHSVIQGCGGSGNGWDPALGIDAGGNSGASPLLGPLQDNGGFTLTMVPGSGSAAIDAGEVSTCPAADQRGVYRVLSAPCDIGAVETVGSSVLSLGDGSAYASYGAVRTYVFTLTNPADTLASGISVSSVVPSEQFEPTAMQWQCIGEGEVHCIESGTGLLQDADVAIPPHANAYWIIGVPIRADASGHVATLSVNVEGLAGQSLSVVDSDVLVLLRAGFDGNGLDRAGIVSAR